MSLGEEASGQNARDRVVVPDTRRALAEEVPGVQPIGSVERDSPPLNGIYIGGFDNNSSLLCLPLCDRNEPKRVGGKGGTRTLDPGIMSSVLQSK